MRNLGLILVASSFACAAPEGEMGGTETETETDGTGSSSGSDATMTATSVTNDPSMATTAGNTMATTSSPSTTNGSDPDSSSTAGDPDTSSSGGDCVPGTLGCPCDIGSTCEDALFCVDGVCQDTPECDEPEGEPNDDEASAVALEEAVCAAPAEDIDGSLSGAESDWFTYHAATAPLSPCFDNPSVTVTSDAELSVCIFAQCDDGDLALDCEGDAEESDSPDGVPGCCALGSVALSNFGCGFMGTVPGTGTVWARVTSIEDACTPYTLEWDY